MRISKAAQGKKAGIFWILVKCFWPTFCLGALYQLIYTLLQFASPQILGLIISFVQSDDPDWKGYLYTILFAIVALVSAISGKSLGNGHAAFDILVLSFKLCILY